MNEQWRVMHRWSGLPMYNGDTFYARYRFCKCSIQEPDIIKCNESLPCVRFIRVKYETVELRKENANDTRYAAKKSSYGPLSEETEFISYPAMNLNATGLRKLFSHIKLVSCNCLGR